jgi:gliding motility-associated-like protein
MYKSISFLVITLLLSYTSTTQAQCAGQIDSASVTVAAAHCGNTNGEILINNTRGGIVTPSQTITYQLNGGTAQSSNIFANLSAGNYTLTITESPSGCTYTHATTIVVGNKQGFTSATESHTNVTACNANNATITVSSLGGVVPNKYQLDFGTAQNSSTIMNVSAGTHFVTITDSKGCDTTISVTIPDLNGITFANYIAYPTSCTSNTGSVKIKTTTGTTPVTMQIDGGTAIAYTDTIVGLAQGVHKVILIDAAGCKFTINTIYIDLQPPYNAYTVHVVTDTCSKNVGKIFITNNAGGAVPATFALDASTTYSANASFNNLPKGTHTLHIKDNNGCLKDTTLTIPTTYKPQGTPTSVPPICGLTNGSITITNITGAAPAYTLTCNGTTANGTNPFTNLAEGDYTIKITDGFGCDSSQQVTLTATNKITSINALLTNVTCGSNLGSINIISVAGGVPAYTYAFNGAAQATPTKASLQQGTYSLHITDVNTCAYDTVVVLTQTNPFDCALTATPATIVTGETATITSTATGTTNVWTGSGAESATGTTVSVSPTATTAYTLTSSTPEGCIATCSTTVVVQPKIIPYKAFSPNGDGKNDIWEITYLSAYPNAEISVFSRWGQRVYQKKKEDSYTPFDGKATSGTALTTGTYFYTIDLNVEDVSDDFNFYKGFIELIK